MGLFRPGRRGGGGGGIGAAMSVSVMLCAIMMWILTLGQLVLGTTTQHTSNWAVLVSTSRFWFNYRHMANVLSMYRTVKRLGIPDSQIILMLPDDMACNPRNVFPGTVYSNADRAMDLYGDNIEVDYRGYEVTVEAFIRLLTDRVGPETARSKRLLTDERSNVLVYMTGHGGDEFLKFQDADELGAWDLAHAIGQMWEKRRYHRLLFMIDTCQANTMMSRIYSPNVIATGSSAIHESSYSHHSDPDVGVAVIDRYTYYTLTYLESHVKDRNCELTLGDLFDSFDINNIRSNPGYRWDLFPGGEEAGRNQKLVDFFSNVQSVDLAGRTSENGTSEVTDGDVEWANQISRIRARWEASRLALGLDIDGPDTHIDRDSTQPGQDHDPGSNDRESEDNGKGTAFAGLPVFVALGLWLASALIDGAFRTKRPNERKSTKDSVGQIPSIYDHLDNNILDQLILAAGNPNVSTNQAGIQVGK